MSMIGKALVHYEITAEIGRGGMGEVYQAKDTKLGRDVAIKVLPEEFALDTDRVARFQREAKLLASLNHPNIAAIYGLEESEGIHFLVMELIEGDTLKDRIKTGPIPVEEALKLALQMAEALEAAHEKGVIHRDLKPANIKVTPEGKVKILDFGLAKAYVGDQENMSPMDSPTLSAAATQQGVILGTAAYMSPEQAKGKSVDKRADIWAFGIVLFEMLTGRQLFTGETASETLASVMKSEPEWDTLPSNLHSRIRFLLERCLKKEPKNRYSGISDARVEIQDVLADPSGVFAQPAVGTEPRTKLRQMLPWIAAALFLGLISAGVAVWKLKPSEPRQVMRFDYELPEGQQFSDSLTALAVSPDGKQFVYSTTNGLYLRSVDELNAKLIPGTEGSTGQPFFSPDGQSIGYFSVEDQQLKKISIRGGAPVTLCAAGQLLLGASWGTDNTIVYGQYPPTAPVMRISANGGTPEEIIQPSPGPVLFPQILPDGGSVLYTAFTSPTQGTIMVQPRKSGEPKELFAGMEARYLSTGHIVYTLPNNNNLYAVAFDLDKLEVKGGPVPIVEGVEQSAVSDAGTLVYIPGTALQTTSAGPLARTLVWVDRQGKEESIHMPPDYYLFPSISPDGKRVALTKRVVVDTVGQHIWIWDLVRETLTPLTTGKSSNNYKPIWTRDGKRIVFMSRRDDKFGIYWKAADGTGEEQVLVLSPAELTMLVPWSWSSDGKTLAMGTLDLAANPAHADIATLSMEGDPVIKELLHAEYNQTHPSISPDGKYMAYMSGEVETGQPEIFVRPFPEVNKGKWPISTGGGESPIWSPDSSELFYRNEGAVMSVSIDTKATFSAGKPRMLFQGPYVTGYEDSPAWDISPDGKKFLMIKQPSPTDKPDSAAGPRKIIVVTNWAEELKERVPVD